MVNTSSLYKQHFGQGSIQEYKIVIGGVEYTDDVLYDITTISQKLFDKPTFTVGSFTVNELNLKLKIPTMNIPANSSIEFYYRYVGSELDPSEWVQKFSGKVSKRTEFSIDVTNIQAKSNAANYDIFLDVATGITSYPANARDVANICAIHLGLIIDNMAHVYNGNVVEYPNEMSVVEVLQNIAKLSGGNWVITENNMLRMVILKNRNMVGSDFSDFSGDATKRKTFPLDMFKGARNLALNTLQSKPLTSDIPTSNSDSTMDVNNQLTWNCYTGLKWNQL